ncbi:uncharacterized protein [Epargyreus clarus]|uniref:uncharacterized protein n=1 Tax=Epargyreus clarus TaxID=520877 RepID=UPI003C2C6306
MFYNNSLMNSSNLGLAWRAGNYQKMDIEEANLPKICDSLDRLLDGNPDRSAPLSLRASSVFIHGVARLYKKEVDSLFKDCYELEMGMALRKTRGMKHESAGERRSSILNILNDSDDSEIRSCDSSSSLKRRSQLSESFRNENRKRSRNNDNDSLEETSSEEDQRDTDNDDDDDDDDDGENSVIPENLSSEENEESPRIETRRIQTQTNNCYLLDRHRKGNTIKLIKHNETNFDKNLPFGCVTIFDSYHDRLPSKIIYSSLKACVKSV